MALVYTFWVAASLALVGLVVDAIAHKRKQHAAFAYASLGLKSVVVAAFIAWVVYFRVLGLSAGDWGDLALFAGIIVLGTPLLVVAVLCDARILFSLVRPARG